MNKLLKASLAAVIALMSHAVQADDDPGQVLNIGLLPYLSPDVLMTRYQPLVDYVAQRLHRPVHVATAPNFPTYLQRAADLRYHLYVTAPHFAALAEQKHGYRRVARLTRELDGAIVVRADSPYQSIDQLRGKTLVTPDQLAIITILGELHFKQQGVVPGEHITLRTAPNHNTALLDVLAHKADVAVVSAAVFESMPPASKSRLRLLTSTQRVPHMMFLAHPQMAEADFQSLKAAVLDFNADGDGQAFFAESGYVDMQPISDADMDAMSTMLPLLMPRIQ